MQYRIQYLLCEFGQNATGYARKSLPLSFWLKSCVKLYAFALIVEREWFQYVSLLKDGLRPRSGGFSCLRVLLRSYFNCNVFIRETWERIACGIYIHVFKLRSQQRSCFLSLPPSLVQNILNCPREKFTWPYARRWGTERGFQGRTSSLIVRQQDYSFLCVSGLVWFVIEFVPI